MSRHDVLIIGGGAAGLSAALVLARARRSVLVIDAGQPRNAPASKLHGYLGRDGLPPAELLSTGRAEVTGYGGDIVAGTVAHLVQQGGDGFCALLSDGTRATARRAVLTTGLRDELPDVPGLWKRWARDVLHCPYCHGHEVRDRPLGVLGGTPEAVRYAQIVRQWTHDLVYFTPPDVLTPLERTQLLARAIGVVEGTVDDLLFGGADQLVGVHLADGRAVPRAALFVPPRFLPNDLLAIDLGCAVDPEGRVVVDRTGLTSVPGLWAAGNVVDPRAQLITAAGAGSAAAIALHADLVQDDVRTAVRDLDHGLPVRDTRGPRADRSGTTTSTLTKESR